MSKWVNNEKFEDFKNQKKGESDEKPNTGGFYLKWENPKMGTQEQPKTYKVRLLPDKNQDFYKRYYYHFFQSDDKTYYIKCPKTDNFENFCPYCYANQLLFKGNKEDQKRAYRYKRNERFVGNVFIVEDPRDVDKESDKKVSGTVKLYEFPATVESKIKNELVNEEEGFGPAIFDPEKGHDLQIKVLAKKPDANGKIWPDYSLTQFSRKTSSIADSDEEIKKIMESVYDLSEYLKSMEKTWEDHEKILKQELIWDDVEEVFRKKVSQTSQNKESDTGNVDSKTVNDQNEPNEETQTYDTSKENDVSKDTGETEDDIDEDALTKELESM